MTPKDARAEIEIEIGMPLDRIQYTDLYILLEDERIARREAEARVKALEEELTFYQHRRG